MSVYLVKPPDPEWQANSAPAGCKLYLPFAEGWGKTARDHAGNQYHGSLVGAPAWQGGLYGPQLGGFTASNYLTIDPVPQVLGSGVYPFWLAALCVNTSTSLQFLFFGGSATTTGNPQIGLGLNVGGTGTADYVLFDDGSSGATISAASQPTNDGLPHALLAVSYKANDHRLYVDGRQATTSSATVGTFTAPWLTVGLRRRFTQLASAFAGSVLAAAAGNGSVPDPAALAADWLAGEFAAVRPRRRSAAMFVGSSAPVYSGSGSPSLSALTPSASVSYAPPVYSGTGTPSLSALTPAASVTYTAPAYSGTGAPALSALTATASVSYATPVYGGTGTPALSDLASSASVSYTAPVVSGSGAPALSALTATATVSYVASGQSGAGTPSLSALTAASTVAYAAPALPGSGAPALSALTPAASVAYADPGVSVAAYFPATFFAPTYFAPAYFPDGSGSGSGGSLVDMPATGLILFLGSSEGETGDVINAVVGTSGGSALAATASFTVTGLPGGTVTGTLPSNSAPAEFSFTVGAAGSYTPTLTVTSGGNPGMTTTVSPPVFVATAAGVIEVTPPAPVASLAIVYCTDEEVALRAPRDYKALCPPWQTLGTGVDGAFAAGDRWTLTSASVDFEAAGVQSGNVVILSKSSAGLSDALFAVDHASTGSVTLRRLGQAVGVGMPPAPAGGLAGVAFDVRTFARQIDDASFDVNRLFGLDPLVPSRAPANIQDVRQLRKYTAGLVVRRALIANSQEKGDDFNLKLGLVTDELNDLRPSLSVRFGPDGNAAPPSSVFGMQVRR